MGVSGQSPVVGSIASAGALTNDVYGHLVVGAEQRAAQLLDIYFDQAVSGPSPDHQRLRGLLYATNARRS
jgi:hypothetical protein